jgi:hypothetical protein
LAAGVDGVRRAAATPDKSADADMWNAISVRRPLFVAALAVLLLLDLSIVPLVLAMVLPGGASAHGAHWVPGSLFFLLVLTVLGWLTAAAVTELRKPTR